MEERTAAGAAHWITKENTLSITLFTQEENTGEKNPK